MHAEEMRIFNVGTILSSFGANVEWLPIIVSIPQELRDCELIAVFCSEGHFPSHSIRVLRSLADAEEKNFDVPDWVYESCLIPIQSCIIIRPEALQTEGLYTALANAHYRDSATGVWRGPKRRRSTSKRERSVQNRHDRMIDRYALQ